MTKQNQNLTSPILVNYALEVAEKAQGCKEFTALFPEKCLFYSPLVCRPEPQQTLQPSLSVLMCLSFGRSSLFDLCV